MLYTLFVRLLLVGSRVLGWEVFPQAGSLPCLPPAEPVHGECCCFVFVFSSSPAWGHQNSFWEHQQLCPRFQGVVCAGSGKGAGQRLCPGVSAGFGDMFQYRYSPGHDTRKRRQPGGFVVVGFFFVVCPPFVFGAIPTHGLPFEWAAGGMNTKPASYAQTAHPAVHFVLRGHPLLDCFNLALGYVTIDVW